MAVNWWRLARGIAAGIHTGVLLGLAHNLFFTDLGGTL